MGIGPAETRPTVLVVTHNYPRDPEDQAGQFIHTLISPIADRFRFVIVAPHYGGLPLRETQGPVEITRFRYGSDAEETLAYAGDMHEQVLKSWRKRFLFLAFLRGMRQAVLRAIHDESPAAIHIHWWVPGALAAAGLATKHKIPYLLTTHGSDVTLISKFGWLKPVAGPLFRRAAARTSVSTYLQNVMRDLFGLDSALLPMPYDDAKFTPREPVDRVPPVVTCIGRLIERKGQKYLLQAAGRLKERGVDCRIQLVGDGPLRKQLASQATDLGIDDRVIFTGNVPHEKIPALIHGSALVVLPSVADWKGEVEGLGMVLAEASACARPVIGTRLGGPIDAVDDGRTGLLVPPADSASLAEAIAVILSDGDQARAYGTAGVEFARVHFSPASQAGKLADLLDRIRRP